MTNPNSVLKQRYYFANKGLYSRSYGLSSSYVRLWELDHKEGRAPKNWCFRTVVLEKNLEGPLDSKEIKQVNLKGNQHWILIGSMNTNAEAEVLILWPPDANSQLIGKKTLMMRKIDSRRNKGERRMRCLDGITDAMDINLGKLREMMREQSLACCSPWGHEESDMTEQHSP